MNPSPSKEAQRRGGESSSAQQSRDSQGQFAGKKNASGGQDSGGGHDGSLAQRSPPQRGQQIERDQGNPEQTGSARDADI